MQQAFDTTGYLIARADEDRAEIRQIKDQQHQNVILLDNHDHRISSLEQSRAQFSRVVQLLLPLLVLTLAGLVALGPALAVDLAQALIKALI